MAADPSESVPPGPLIADLHRARELATTVNKELESVVPWLGPLQAAILGAQKLRLKLFLESIDRAERQLKDDERARFRAWMASAAGMELLHDYAQATVQTGSEIARAALGLLYASRDESTYPMPFRRSACEGLAGIGNDRVEMLLSILDVAERMQAAVPHGETEHVIVEGGAVELAGPYAVMIPDAAALAASTGLSVASLVVGVRSLANRGLLLPDPSSGRYGGDKVLTFGVGEDTLRFRRLLSSAKQSIK